MARITCEGKPLLINITGNDMDVSLANRVEDLDRLHVT
jgi:hypothetical protein